MVAASPVPTASTPLKPRLVLFRLHFSSFSCTCDLPEDDAGGGPLFDRHYPVSDRSSCEALHASDRTARQRDREEAWLLAPPIDGFADERWARKCTKR